MCYGRIDLQLFGEWQLEHIYLYAMVCDQWDDFGVALLRDRNAVSDHLGNLEYRSYNGVRQLIRDVGASTDFECHDAHGYCRRHDFQCKSDAVNDAGAHPDQLFPTYGRKLHPRLYLCMAILSDRDKLDGYDGANRAESDVQRSFVSNYLFPTNGHGDPVRQCGLYQCRNRYSEYAYLHSRGYRLSGGRRQLHLLRRRNLVHWKFLPVVCLRRGYKRLFRANLCDSNTASEYFCNMEFRLFGP